MTPCSGPRFASSPLRFPGGAPGRRFAAALVLSVLVHTIGGTRLSGERGNPSKAPGVTPFSVHLVQSAAPEAIEDERPPEHERTAPAPRTFERERKPAPARVPAVKAPPPAVPALNGGGAVAEARDNTYYAAKQLDVYPSLSTPLDLDRITGRAGRALLLVLIDAAGTVDDVSLVEATPQSIAEEDAKRVFMSARFTPAYRNGRAVKSRMLIEVNYGQ